MRKKWNFWGITWYEKELKKGVKGIKRGEEKKGKNRNKRKLREGEKQKRAQKQTKKKGETKLENYKKRIKK